MEDFKQWFEEKHGVWPWHPSDLPVVANRRFADGVAEFVSERVSKIDALERELAELKASLDIK